MRREKVSAEGMADTIEIKDPRKIAEFEAWKAQSDADRKLGIKRRREPVRDMEDEKNNGGPQGYGGGYAAQNGGSEGDNGNHENNASRPPPPNGAKPPPPPKPAEPPPAPSKRNMLLSGIKQFDKDSMLKKKEEQAELAPEQAVSGETGLNGLLANTLSTYRQFVMDDDDEEEESENDWD